MKVLVTGIAGFIGHALAKQLLAMGLEVVGLDNINDYYDVNLKLARLKDLGIQSSGNFADVELNKNGDLSFHKIDLTDTDSVFRLFARENVDAVCHLAAQAGVRYSLENPFAYTASNVNGFLSILEGCRQHGVENLCYASSSSVYGLNKAQPFSTSSPTEHPVSLYAATKKANEMMAHTYSHLYGIRTTGLRFFTVYGPWGRPDMAPFLFTDAILNNRPIKVFNHGKMRRDFTYIDDIVNGIIKVLHNPASSNPDWDPLNPNIDESSAPYKILNIGYSSPVKLMDFIGYLEKALGKDAHKTFLPMQDGDVVSTFADVGALIRDYDYRPSVDMAHGVQKFVDWYLDFYQVGDPPKLQI